MKLEYADQYRGQHGPAFGRAIRKLGETLRRAPVMCERCSRRRASIIIHAATSPALTCATCFSDWRVDREVGRQRALRQQMRSRS